MIVVLNKWRNFTRSFVWNFAGHKLQGNLCPCLSCAILAWLFRAGFVPNSLWQIGQDIFCGACLFLMCSWRPRKYL